MRRAGAAAREMLMRAAGEEWSVAGSSRCARQKAFSIMTLQTAQIGAVSAPSQQRPRNSRPISNRESEIDPG